MGTKERICAQWTIEPTARFKRTFAASGKCTDCRATMRQKKEAQPCKNAPDDDLRFIAHCAGDGLSFLEVLRECVKNGFMARHAVCSAAGAVLAAALR